MTTVSGALDTRLLDAALPHANLPTLVMVLYQLTGDDRWLSPPYRPTRPRGTDDHDGGFDDATKAGIIAAARDALLAWSDGRAPAVAAPRGRTLRRMMAACTGERRIPEHYDTMVSSEMGFAPEVDPPALDRDLLAARKFRVVVIGAGIGGLLTAHFLTRAGIPVTVLEKKHDVGGTWLANGYPGAGVDTPSYLYSFSFFARDWSRYFPKREEVLRYLNDFADHFGLRDSIRFGAEVRTATYDENDQSWRVEYTTPDGQVHTIDAAALVSAVGIFGRPAIPAIPGLDQFEGDAFHSAGWPEGFTVDGKRVAVVGSGASAMQIVPATADRAERITIFQRSPMWASGSEQYFRTVPDKVHWLINNVPFYQQWYRFQLAWLFNDRVHPTLTVDPEWPHPERALNAANDRHRAMLTRYITEQLAGRTDLLAKSLPSYPPFGKRMLIDNGWYQALQRPNVELLAESCVRVTKNGIVGSDGSVRDVDVIVLSTGFETQRYLAPMLIRGRDNRSLREEWQDDDARAHLGLTVPGYPNLFMVYGPNTNGAGGSYLTFAESQVGYIVSLIRILAEGTAGAIEPTTAAFQDYNDRMDRRHANMVWTHPGMTSYYRNRHGRVVVNRPWSVVEYWLLTRRPNLADYVLEPVRRPAG